MSDNPDQVVYQVFCYLGEGDVIAIASSLDVAKALSQEHAQKRGLFIRIWAESPDGSGHWYGTTSDYAPYKITAVNMDVLTDG